MSIKERQWATDTAEPGAAETRPRDNKPPLLSRQTQRERSLLDRRIATSLAGVREQRTSRGYTARHAKLTAEACMYIRRNFTLIVATARRFCFSAIQCSAFSVIVLSPAKGTFVTSRVNR